MRVLVCVKCSLVVCVSSLDPKHTQPVHIHDPIAVVSVEVSILSTQSFRIDYGGVCVIAVSVTSVFAMRVFDPI